MPVLRHEIHDVIIVPQKQRTFCNLEMRRIDAHRDSPEQGKHSLDKLCCLREFQHFLQFPEKQDLLLAVCDRPVLQQSSEYSIRESWILFHELSDAVRQLLVIHSRALRFVQRQESALKENLMFLFQGECKTVNDTSKNLKQLRDTVVPLRLVNEPVKYVVDGLPDEGSMCHEFSIDPVQDRLEVIALARGPLRQRARGA